MLIKIKEILQKEKCVQGSHNSNIEQTNAWFDFKQFIQCKKRKPI